MYLGDHSCKARTYLIYKIRFSFKKKKKIDVTFKITVEFEIIVDF
jgi:hypothetical protein